MKVFLIFALLLLVAIQYGQAVVEPMQFLPPDLQQCLDNCHTLGDLRNQSGQLVFWTSIQMYISKFAQSVSNLSISETKLFDATLYEVLKPLSDSNPRRKRQTSDTRVRREVRTMSTSERRRYLYAVNAMKNDRRLSPNVYDVIARLHTVNVGRAHTGPAFPSWHRLYVYIFESILRLWYDGSVTVPYWDSVLDQRMADPRFSVIWSDEFYGNGFGIVRTGPFRNWRFLPAAQPIERNLGRASRILMTEAGIRRVLSQTRNSQILFPTSTGAFNLELEHGGPHNFVGGSMQNLPTAAFDPIFFSHHAFIDYIWELFRFQQRRNNINPEADYPFNPNDPRFSRSHAPDATAGFRSIGSASVLDIQFGDLTQRIGYSNRFFDLVQYIDTPICPDCGDSPFLYCSPRLNRCVSRTAAESRGFGAFGGSSSAQQAASQEIVEIPELPLNQSRIPPPTVDLLQETQMPTNSEPNDYISKHIESSCSRRPFINDIDTKKMGSSGEWAYIPVNVISKRPDTIEGYQDYSLYKTQAEWANPNSLGFKYEFTKPGSQYEFEGCSKMQGAVGNIRIASWGINYDGYAQEDVIVDNRLGVSQGNGFLPVKKPTAYNPSEFITIAYDSCGRVCKPYCTNKNHDHVNDHFSGGFRATIDSPKQYSNSYEEAMLSIWEMASPFSSPIIDYGDIPITFFCEYTDEWIWDKPPPSTPPPPTTRQTPPSYNQMPTNYGPGIVPDPRYPASHGDFCVVAPDCSIDVPCGGCADFDYQYCRGEQKLAICMYGKFSVTTAITAHTNHFYSK